MIKDLANKCLGCTNPMCEVHCPLHNNIRDFIKEIKNNNYQKAREILDLTSPFPYICSHICDYNRQCFGNCIRNKFNDPVYIYEIEKELSKIDLIKRKAPYNNIKVAIIGSGVAGLALAKLLAIKGYEVEIFEKEKFIGGTIKTGIPSYRLDPTLIEKMIIEVKNLNVKFNLNKIYPLDFNISTLKESGFKKIIFALGAQKGRLMKIEGKEYAKDGLSLLYDLNINKNIKEYQNYKNVFIVGGGNVAMDCARSLKRIIHDVTIIYRRSIKEMPANTDEIKDALNEGIKIIELHNPIKICSENNIIAGFDAEILRLGDIDDSGRASFVATGKTKYFACDLLIMAIGQETIIDNKELELMNNGTIKIDSKYHTNIEDVYAIGDVTSGPTNVARAIFDAKDLANKEF